jgi:hypothetical protein
LVDEVVGLERGGRGGETRGAIEDEGFGGFGGIGCGAGTGGGFLDEEVFGKGRVPTEFGDGAFEGFLFG